MGFQEPITMAKAIRMIQVGELVLPAIQREFVWDDRQIVRLFDSVLRGYPIGSFLSWKVTPESAKEFQFYGFIRDYHEKDHPYCPKADIPSGQTVTAVLDGQQRLTALNIGLRGSDARRVKGGWWDNPKSFPKRQLYLNVLADAPENELGMKYDLRMMAEPPDPIPEQAYWFRMRSLYEMEEMADLLDALAEHQLGNNRYATKVLGSAFEAIHNVPSLNFFEEDSQDVEKVLDIFIRVNSGGTTLSYSDLLLSIATAQWGERDAREEVRSLVGELNSSGQGFRFSKDVVLKSGLVLTGVKEIGFKVKNFNRTNMTALEHNWESVSDALLTAVGLLSDFGLSEARMTADSVVIPIAYYIHRRQLADNYRTKPGYQDDRRKINGWVIRSLIKRGVWGSGLDTLLRELRNVIDADTGDGFPVASIERAMAAQGKSLAFVDEEIDELLDTKYTNARVFAILALLYPHVDTRNLHHIDHVYPRALLGKKILKDRGLTDDDVRHTQDLRGRLANLQLLEGPANIGKSDLPPMAWATKTYPGDSFNAYLNRNALPGLPADAHDFPEWIGRRRELIRVRLSSIHRY